MATAQCLAQIAQVKYFRAGIWKPRTHPGDFEGAGDAGLEWLKEASATTGLKSCVEVANAQHAGKAVAAGIDMVWIGARTTVNPFLVEEIAQALRGTGIPVLVKNPINPDIQLWIGALERFYRNGVTQIGAIHRGFSSFHKGRYRNEPFWELVFEMRRRIPTLPIITDPSHIAGDSNMVAELSQQALDLETDGLMIEVHPSPKQALTDRKQQLGLREFATLIGALIYRKTHEDASIRELQKLRTAIDEVDMEIIRLLAHRMDIVRRIGDIKHKNRLTLLQKERWNEVVRSRLGYGELNNVDKGFLLKVLQNIHEESLRIQSDIFNREEV